MEIPKFNVLGVAVSAMDLDIATEAVVDACAARRKGYVCVTGVHGVTEAQSDQRGQSAYCNIMVVIDPFLIGNRWIVKWLEMEHERGVA